MSYTARPMRVALATTLAAAAAAGCGAGGPAGRDAGGGGAAAAAAPPAALLPQFTAGDSLRRPEGWEGWVLAGTSIGLTYNERPRVAEAGAPPGNFLNVYMQPWAYERFRETGEFAEGTMFILAGAQPVRKADPARGGFYQGELSLLEVHVKREGLHESGWGFYGFRPGEATARLISGDAACYSCHRDNAAFDNVFTQFYPPLRELVQAAHASSGDAAPGGGS